jgi:hypothetical protein
MVETDPIKDRETVRVRIDTDAEIVAEEGGPGRILRADQGRGRVGVGGSAVRGAGEGLRRSGRAAGGRPEHCRDQEGKGSC